jgi:hypothetical protein
MYKLDAELMQDVSRHSTGVLFEYLKGMSRLHRGIVIDIAFCINQYFTPLLFLGLEIIR